MAIAAAGVGVQSLTLMNHDVSWVLWSSGRLLDGGVFGRDIVAANPPLVWWISAIPMEAARLSGLPAITCFNLFMLALLSASLLASDRLLRFAMPDAQRGFVLGAAAFLLTFGASRDFGQREHITAILTLPYLLLVLARIRGEASSTAFAVLVGAGAAVGFGFKPHLFAVPLLVEAYLTYRTGFRRTLLRPEAAAAVVTASAYIAAVLVFARPYLFESLPDIARVYWAFDKPDLAYMAEKTIDCAVILPIAVALLAWRKWQTDATLFTLAAAGFMLAALVQWKGYSYHLYPVLAYSALAFSVMLYRAGLMQTLIGMLALTYVAAVSITIILVQMPGGAAGIGKAAMVDFVNDHTAAGGRFLAISTHPYPGFPTTLLSHASWAARTNSRIYLPAVVRLRHDGRPEDVELLDFATAKEHQAMLADMTPPPDLVLVDVRPWRHAIFDIPFDFISFYREDPAFAALWTNYIEIPGGPPGFRAFGLKRASTQ